MRKGCNSLVNTAYRLRIPFKLDFTRFLWICASAKDVLRAENANHQICSKKNENLKSFLFSFNEIGGVERLSDVSNHYLLTKEFLKFG